MEAEGEREREIEGERERGREGEVEEGVRGQRGVSIVYIECCQIL